MSSLPINQSISGNENTWDRILRSPISNLVGKSLVFLIAFANLITILDADQDTTTSLDLQSFLKLGLIAGYGVYFLQRAWVDVRVLSTLLSGTGLWLTCLCIWLLLSSAFSVMPLVSLASAGSSCICIFGTIAACLQFGPRRVVEYCFWGCLAFLVGSVAYWVVVPERATWVEPMDAGQSVSRFAGLSHPNALGQYAGFVLLLLGLGIPFQRPGSRAAAWLIAAVAISTLYYAWSRTAIIACIGGLCIAKRQQFQRGTALFSGLVILLSVGVATLFLITQEPFAERTMTSLLRLASKSGTIEELTSGTGRLAIWNETVTLVGARPWTGYGAATSKVLLEDFSRYTHNLWLNLALCAGLPAVLLLGCAVCRSVIAALRRPAALPDGLLAFVLISGLAENVCFLVIDSAPMILLISALMWRTSAAEFAFNCSTPRSFSDAHFDPLAAGGLR